MITSRIMIIVHLAANGFLKKNQFVITPGIHATSKISGRLLIHWMICSALMYVVGYAAQRIVEPVAMDQRSPKRKYIRLISEDYVMMHIALSVERALMSIEYLIAKDVHIAGQEYPGLHGIDKMRNA